MHETWRTNCEWGGKSDKLHIFIVIPVECHYFHIYTLFSQQIEGEMIEPTKPIDVDSWTRISAGYFPLWSFTKNDMCEQDSLPWPFASRPASTGLSWCRRVWTAKSWDHRKDGWLRRAFVEDEGLRHRKVVGRPRPKVTYSAWRMLFRNGLFNSLGKAYAVEDQGRLLSRAPLSGAMLPHSWLMPPFLCTLRQCRAPLQS